MLLLFLFFSPLVPSSAPFLCSYLLLFYYFYVFIIYLFICHYFFLLFFFVFFLSFFFFSPLLLLPPTTSLSLSQSLSLLVVVLHLLLLSSSSSSVPPWTCFLSIGLSLSPRFPLLFPPSLSKPNFLSPSLLSLSPIFPCSTDLSLPLPRRRYAREVWRCPPLATPPCFSLLFLFAPSPPHEPHSSFPFLFFSFLFFIFFHRRRKK